MMHCGWAFGGCCALKWRAIAEFSFACLLGFSDCKRNLCVVAAVLKVYILVIVPFFCGLIDGPEHRMTLAPDPSGRCFAPY